MTEVPLSPEDPQMCAPENEAYNFASVWRSGKLFTAEAMVRSNLPSVRGKRLYSPAPRAEAKMFGVVPLFCKMPMPGSEDDHDDDDGDDIKRITSVSKPMYGRGYPRLELSAACGGDLEESSKGWDALPAHHAYTTACASTRCKWRDARRFAGANCAFHWPFYYGARNWPEIVIMTEGVWVRPTNPQLLAKPSFRIGLDMHMKVMGFRFGIEHAAFESSISADSSETFSTYQVSRPLVLLIYVCVQRFPLFVADSSYFVWNMSFIHIHTHIHIYPNTGELATRQETAEHVDQGDCWIPQESIDRQETTKEEEDTISTSAFVVNLRRRRSREEGNQSEFCSC